jgi:transposase
MARPPALPPEEKTKLVLAVLAGSLSLAQAARQAGVSEQAVGNWRRQFVEAGSQGLAGGDRQRGERERRLEAQITELKMALGEAHVQLRSRRGVPVRPVAQRPGAQLHGLPPGRPAPFPAAAAAAPAHGDPRARRGA